MHSSVVCVSLLLVVVVVVSWLIVVSVHQPNSQRVAPVEHVMPIAHRRRSRGARRVATTIIASDEQPRIERKAAAPAAAPAPAPATAATKTTITSPPWLRDLHMQSKAAATAAQQLVSVIIDVESTRRDRTRWPTADHYQYTCSPPLTNVVSVALQNCVFPKTECGVSPAACWLDVSLDGVVSSVCLPPGSYDNDRAALVAALQNRFDNKPLLLPLRIRYLRGLDKIELVCMSEKSSVQLLFGSGVHQQQSMWKQLGFAQQDTVVAKQLVSEHAMDLGGPQRVEVFCEELRNTPNHSVGSMLLRADGVHSSGYSGSAMWPITKLQTLTLCLVVQGVDDQWRPYYCAGLDHTLQLRVTTRAVANNLLEEVELDVAF